MVFSWLSWHEDSISPNPSPTLIVPQSLAMKTQNASVRIVHLKLLTSLPDHVPGPITPPNNTKTARIPKTLCAKRNHGGMCSTKWHSKKQHFWQSHHFVEQHAVFTLTYEAPDTQTMKVCVVRRVIGRVTTCADALVPSLPTGELREKAKF